MTKGKLALLGFFLLICLLVGLIGGHFTQESVHTWYLTLKKPSWTPPSFVFPIAWTILYILMAVAAWLVAITSTTPSKKKLALGLFAAQLFYNFIWSFLFFSLQSPLFAFIDIILLITTLSATIIAFYLVRPVAAYLLIPYILWVAFALCLNGAILMMN